jgi:homoserine kinase type II
MKLSKKEVKCILDNWDLGRLERYKPIKGGLVNYNYLIQTEKGKYIIRISGNSSKAKLNHLKLQFKILSFLKKHNFPYETPQPVKSVKSGYILRIGGKTVWVYRLIKGQNRNRPNLLQIKQMARALATYHKYIKNLKGKSEKDPSKKRIESGFERMSSIKPRDDADKLAIIYGPYFQNLFNELKSLHYSSNKLFVHSDFDASNVLFHNGKLKAIIDFDEANYAPRIFDVAISLRDSCYTNGKLDMGKTRLFLREYEKISKLEKNEKKVIIPIILYANIDFFVWAYAHMKKEPENKKKYMKEMIVLTENIIKNYKMLGSITCLKQCPLWRH